jgi:uncharacterized membrane protein YhaH (DUF805 family)
MEVLKKYTFFSGRARRAEYWYFTLISLTIAVLSFSISKILYLLYGVFVMIPSIAVGVRRLHDTDRSGWWMFIAGVPFIGGLILLVLLTQDSTQGDNKYGPNPKMPTPPVAPIVPTPIA